MKSQVWPYIFFNLLLDFSFWLSFFALTSVPDLLHILLIIHTSLYLFSPESAERLWISASASKYSDIFHRISHGNRLSLNQRYLIFQTILYFENEDI